MFSKPNITSLYLLLKNTLDNCNVSCKVYYINDYKRTFFNGLLGVINAILIEFELYECTNKKSYNFAKNIKTLIAYRKLLFDSIAIHKKYLKFKLLEYKELTDTFLVLENCLLIIIKLNNKLDKKTIAMIRLKLIDIFQKDFNYLNNIYKNIEEFLTINNFCCYKS